MTEEMKELRRRLGAISNEMVEKGQYEKNRGLIAAMFTLDSLVQRNDRENMPVIPKEWADTIAEYKANHYRLSEIFTECDWNYDEQELIARAWLDGYRVEAQHDTRTA